MNKKGFSLVVLIITIIVMIIIAATVVLNLEDTNTINEATESKLSGQLDNVQQKLSEIVSEKMMENKRDLLPSDRKFMNYFTQIGESDYYLVNLEMIGLGAIENEGVYIIDEGFNAYYLEEFEDYILPEDSVVPSEVRNELFN